MSRMGRVHCGGCDYFARGGEGHEHRGECRRYAPTVVANGFQFTWPDVGTEDWCGEFKAKQIKPVPEWEVAATVMTALTLASGSICNHPQGHDAEFQEAKVAIDAAIQATKDWV
jgi:hypothetical protein